MVVIGGITRLTHSGLSMVEWDLVMGAVPPITDSDWNATFELYQTSPEFQKVNSNFTLSEFKSIFWWEYIHRMWGRLIGLVFIIPFCIFLFQKRIDRALMPKLLVLLGLGAFQGFLGWFMVKSGLVDKPAVSHYRLAAHLITAFLTAMYTLWVAMGLYFKESQTQVVPVSGTVRTLTKVAFGVVLLQIIYGAFVAGLKGGDHYRTWPKMGDTWIGHGITNLDPVWLNFVEGPIGTQFVHRYLAVAVFAIIALIFWKTRNQKLVFSQRLAVNGMFFTVLIQFYLGVQTLVQGVPVYMGVIHQVGAFFLLSFCVIALHRLQKGALILVRETAEENEPEPTEPAVASMGTD